MSKKINIKNSISFIMAVVLIAFVVTIISVVHNFTTKRFENTKYIDNIETFTKIMPGNYEFVLLNDNLFSSIKEKKLKVYKAIDEGIIYGYIADMTFIGHSGEINLIAGISPNGVISEVEVLYFNEALNIGSKVLKKDYLDKFKGLSYPLEFSEEETTLDTISSDIETLNAVRTALNKALLAVKLAKEDTEQMTNDN